MSKSRSIAIAAFGFVSAFLTSSSDAAVYRFVKIVDTNDTKWVNLDPPVINLGGTAAFRAEFRTDPGDPMSPTETGVFLAREDEVITLAQTGGALDLYSAVGDPSINNGGGVAFTVTFVGGQKAVVVAHGAGHGGGGEGGAAEPAEATPALSIIATTGGTNPNYSDFGRPHIINRGNVVFRAVLAGGGEQIVLVDKDQNRTVLVETGAAPHNFTAFGNPVMTQGGLVAFRAEFGMGSVGVFIYDPNIEEADKVVKLAETGTDLVPGGPYTDFGDASISAGGKVGFRAQGSAALILYSREGEVGPYTGNLKVDTDDGEFDDFGNPAVGGESLIFLGDKVVEMSTIEGIYNGGVAGKIVEEGDVLEFGTVADLAFARGLGAEGTAAFRADLDGGVHGLYIAIPVKSVNDLDGDGKSDLLLHHTVSGNLRGRLIDGVTTVEEADLGTLNTNWRVFGARDFTGDGKADIVFHNTVDGRVRIQPMDGLTPGAFVNLMTANPNWTMVGIGFLNKREKPDIVWHNRRNGEAYITFLDDTEDAPLQPATTVLIGTMGTNWKLLGLGGFAEGGNEGGGGPPPVGHTQLVWRNAVTGALRISFLNADTGVIVESVDIGTVNPNWVLRSIADFDLNGRPELVFQHESLGSVRVQYLAADARSLGTSVLAASGGSNWRLMGSGDFDADGQAEMVFHNLVDGRVRKLVMATDGLSPVGFESLDPVPTARRIRGLN